MSLNPLALLEKAINEHGSSSILNERILLVKEMLDKVEIEKAELEKSLRAAREEIEELKKKIPGSKFVEYRGAKFRRKPSGGYENAVYCPSCETGMATIPNKGLPFACARCNALTTFCSQDLSSILEEVAAEYP